MKRTVQTGTKALLGSLAAAATLLLVGAASQRGAWRSSTHLDDLGDARQPGVNTLRDLDAPRAHITPADDLLLLRRAGEPPRTQARAELTAALLAILDQRERLLAEGRAQASQLASMAAALQLEQRPLRARRATTDPHVDDEVSRDD